ncbi:MAG: universal stress protein [Geminicoccaceae bacterium]
MPLSGQYDLADPESLERPALETAFILGRRLNAHVEVYCIEADLTHTQSRLSPWIPGSSVDVLIDMIAKESIERRDRARALFQSVAERFSAARTRRPDSNAGFSVNFLEEMGEVEGSLSVRGRLADLIVTACFALERDGDIPLILNVALRETGRPVLISSSTASDTFGKRIAIAWNGSAEAVRAAGLAMEFLQHAEEVVVISVNEHGPFEPSAESLAEYLQWQEIRSRTVTVDGSAASAGALLLEQIEHLGSDMLVMGAYTRDRIQRVIFGGVTGEVLARMPVPVLMVD